MLKLVRRQYNDATVMLKKNSPIPLYLQVAQWFEKKIQAGEYKVGGMLPSELELTRKFDITRGTVRHAFSYLRERGLLEKRRGVGAFVLKDSILSPVHHLGKLTSFKNDFEIQEVLLEERLISKTRIGASPEIAAMLDLEPAMPVIQVERLRIAQGVPLVLERHIFSQDKFNRLLDMQLEGSMFRLLVQEFNLDLAFSEQFLRAVNMTADVASKLQVPLTTPCIYVENKIYDSEYTLIELLQSWYRGDKYLFKIETGHYVQGFTHD
jgi:GntR family transcriptional regulator